MTIVRQRYACGKDSEPILKSFTQFLENISKDWGKGSSEKGFSAQFIFRKKYFNHLINAASSMPIDNPIKAACHVHLISSALTKPPIAPHRYLSRRLNLNVCSAKPSSISQVAKSETNAKNEPIIRRQGVSTRPRTLSRIIFPSNNSPRIMEPASNIT